MFKTHLEFEEASKIPGKISEQQLIEFLTRLNEATKQAGYFQSWIEKKNLPAFESITSLNDINEYSNVFNPFINLFNNGDISLRVANLMFGDLFEQWYHYGINLQKSILPRLVYLDRFVYKIIAILDLLPVDTDFEDALLTDSYPICHDIFPRTILRNILFENGVRSYLIFNCMLNQVELPKSLINTIVKHPPVMEDLNRISKSLYLPIVDYRYLPRFYIESICELVAERIIPYIHQYVYSQDFGRSKYHVRTISPYLSSNTLKKLIDLIAALKDESPDQHHENRRNKLSKILQLHVN